MGFLERNFPKIRFFTLFRMTDDQISIKKENIPQFSSESRL